jgi:hypothetical protein
MATATLDDIVESNLLGAEKLESIEQQFKEFFKQSAADKLDMLEVMREMGPGDGEPGAPGDTQPAQEEQGGGFGGIGRLFGLGTLLTVLAAVQLNAMGAVGSFKLLKKDLEKLPESLKNAGKAVGEFATNAKDSIVSRFNTIKDSIITKITESETFKKAQDIGSKAKDFVSGGIDKAKSFGANAVEGITGFFDKIKSFAAPVVENVKQGAQNLGSKVSQGVSTAKEFVTTKAQAIGAGAKEKFQAFSQTKAGQVLGKAARGVNRVLAPLAVVTSGYEGFKMATEEASKELGTAGQIAVGTAGAASSFFGGLGDFVKLVTVDAPTELANRLGIVSDETADKIQDFSIQRDVTDALVRGARDGIRSAMSEGIEKQTMQRVAENAERPVIVNNVTDASTNVSNATAVTGANSAPPTPVNNNGTFSDAWAGA